MLLKVVIKFKIHKKKELNLWFKLKDFQKHLEKILNKFKSIIKHILNFKKMKILINYYHFNQEQLMI